MFAALNCSICLCNAQQHCDYTKNQLSHDQTQFHAFFPFGNWNFLIRKRPRTSGADDRYCYSTVSSRFVYRTHTLKFVKAKPSQIDSLLKSKFCLLWIQFDDVYILWECLKTVKQNKTKHQSVQLRWLNLIFMYV